MSRHKICYLILALSIVFFLSSVCTFAVLAVTKEDKVAPTNIEKIENSSYVDQRRIIKRLKRIEERMKKRKNRNRK